MKVNIWSDPWVADEEGCFITSARVRGFSQVCDLIDMQRMEWKEEVLASVFNERDQNCIFSIPLSSRVPQDMLTWAFSKDGLYSTKTAYMLGKGYNFDNFHQAWVEIWIMEASPKGAELWEESGCEASLRDISGSFYDPLERWKSKDAKLVQRAVYLAWIIWSERNRKVFDVLITPNKILVDRIRRLVDEFRAYSKKIYGVTGKKESSNLNRWIAPRTGFVKLNSDASLVEEGWVGLGVVARNSKGEVLLYVVRRVRARWPPEIAEAKALAMVVKLAKAYGFADVVLESDCQVLVNRLSKAAVYFSDLDGVIEDILNLSGAFNSFSWSHVKRGWNIVAHHLARLLPFGVEQVWINHCPNEVAPYVLSDMLSID
ncbi:uncharacterized protein LOC110704378 [Chenopodium quinoa]|uniref:uncharacterized protein LOC110704378 n=1 Tax=Chenopodium quinoa TaxID=63459 RepID=UPI000B7918FF|nr:uncharacterized protein LOC110704378 [Chenopodium quinoa]